MIALGVAAVQRFRWVLLLFALVLIFSAYKMLGEEEEADDLSENYVMKLARWLVHATDQYDGDRFFTSVGGQRRATPMLVVLVCIELSDVIFAVDSIPAVVGITQDAFIVYSSNAFALLALRSLYLLLSRSIQQLHYLRHAVALILGFVGVKMVRLAAPVVAFELHGTLVRSAEQYAAAKVIVPSCGPVAPYPPMSKTTLALRFLVASMVRNRARAAKNGSCESLANDEYSILDNRLSRRE
ncbi:MAG: hypothetical protein SGPRY_008665 [Prymnesium sp.]